MPEELIIRHCSPTLAGLKTGNLFNYVYENKEQVEDAINRCNRRTKSKGIQFRLMRFSGKRALVYVYRPDRLILDLQGNEAVEILSSLGYPTLENGQSLDGQLDYLETRLRGNSSFPHEIGLFLGYPTEDVAGFMVNHGTGYKCAGLWKVYGDVNKAKTMFERFKDCGDSYLKKWQLGASLDELAIAI